MRKNTIPKPVKSMLPKSASEKKSVCLISEPPLESGEVWRMSGRHGIAYVKSATIAGELLAVDPKNLARDAMAVYYDKKGKAIAWQIRFDTDRWEEVHRKLRSSS